MRKRFISGLTAVCIVGILITNMITSASAVISAAVVGASVAGSLLLGTLFNQMCGGQGYDFTNAFQDAVQLYTDWEEDFDGSAKDPIHPVTKVEIDTSKVNIPDNVNFNSVGGTSADKMLIEMQKAINSGLEDGSIEISFDENDPLQEKIDARFFNINKRVARCYDTMAMFNASEPKQLQQKTILSPAEFNAQRKKEGEQGA